MSRFLQDLESALRGTISDIPSAPTAPFNPGTHQKTGRRLSPIGISLYHLYMEERQKLLVAENDRDFNVFLPKEVLAEKERLYDELLLSSRAAEQLLHVAISSSTGISTGLKSVTVTDGYELAVPICRPQAA